VDGKIVYKPNSGFSGSDSFIYEIVDAQGAVASAAVKLTLLQTDTTPPIITLKGDNPQMIYLGEEYQELGATAIDNQDGDLTSQIEIIAEVDTHKLGDYLVKYRVSDSSNNSISVTRLVRVIPIQDSSGIVTNNRTGKTYNSIQAAVDDAKSGDTIIVGDGIYHEQIRVDKNLILRSANGAESTIIAGDKVVDGWQYNSRLSLYQAPSPCSNVKSLFIDGVEQKASRYPKSGYLSVKNATSKSRFAISNFSLTNSDIQNAIAHIRMSPWRASSRRVRSYEGGYINLESEVSADGMDIQPGVKLFFTQVLGVIESDNEWAFVDDTIYLKSQNEPENVTVGCSEYGIYLDAGAKNVEIAGFTITRVKGHGITKKEDTRKSASDDLYIHNNIITYVTGRGVVLKDFYDRYRWLPSDTIIKDNEIAFARSGGIEIFEDNALIEGNYIHDIGASKYNDDILSDDGGNMSTGINVLNSSGAIIVNNRIDKVGYNGIAITNYWAGWMSNGGRVIENNYISNALLALNDGGCIYTYTNKIDYINAGVTPEVDIIRNNIVQNCMGSYVGSSQYRDRAGEGIYLDDLSSYTEVYGNTVIGATKSLFLHNAFDINVSNNSFIYPYHVNIFLGQNGQNGEDRENVSITHNKIFSGSRLSYQVVYNDGQEYLTEANYNEIWVLEYTPVKIVKGYGNSPNLSFTIWQNYGYDIDSQIIQNNMQPIVLINPSKSNLRFLKLDGCKTVNGEKIESNSLSVSPFSSKVLFGCRYYLPKVYSKSL